MIARDIGASPPAAWPEGIGALSYLRRSGAYDVYAVEASGLEALQFDPTGAGLGDPSPDAPAPFPAAAEALAEAEHRFIRLGERLQALELRAAVRIHAVVRAPEGCFWVQSPCPITLHDWLAAHPGPLPSDVLSAFVRCLGEAVAELHEHGVVHGDICPRTIGIADGRVVLTEFAVDRRAFFKILRTQGDLVAPGYAAPEAHDGAMRQPIGQAADIYAASAVVFRLLTGQAPPAATDIARLTGQSLWPVDDRTPQGLRAAVDKGMAMSASDRPQGPDAWLAGFDLGARAGPQAWFDDVPLLGDLGIPEPPRVGLIDFGPMSPGTVAAVAASPPRPRRTVLWASLAVATLALTAAAAVVVKRAPPRMVATPSPAAATAAAPAAPGGCRWVGAAAAWRLHCDDDPTIAADLPARFDARTVTLAEQGNVAAMERLGAFYRRRAARLGGAAGDAYAYQAYAWLGRAADAPPTGKGDDARARDDAALALGRMLRRGEGGRAVNLADAEARFRQAAAGDRADAVLALANFLKDTPGSDPARMADARQLFWRVAQLRDGSALQVEAAKAIGSIDAAATAAAAAAAAAKAAEAPPPPAVVIAERPPAPPPPPIAKAAPPAPKAIVAKAPSAKPPTTKATAPKPAAPPAAKPPAKVASAPPARRSPPPAITPQAAPRAASAPEASPFSYRVRTWTASSSIRVDPSSDFVGDLQASGRAVCRSQGGEAVGVRQGEVNCPTGVDYCQVRAIATCQGQ